MGKIVVFIENYELELERMKKRKPPILVKMIILKKKRYDKMVKEMISSKDGMCIRKDITKLSGYSCVSKSDTSPLKYFSIKSLQVSVEMVLF